MTKFNMPPKNLRFFALGVMLFVGYFVLLVTVALNAFTSLDNFATLWLQSIFPRVVDLPLSIFSLLGTFEVMTLILAILALMFFRKTKIMPFSLVLFGALLILEIINKRLLAHPGPPPDLLRYDLPLELPSGMVGFANSFPSGHVSRTIFVAVFALFSIWRLVKDKVVKKWAIVSVVALVGIMIVSRVYLGEHWLSDVLGGFLLGGALGCLALVYY